LAALAVDKVFDLCLLKTGNGGTFGVSRYRYSSDRERVDNITDWALDQFRAHYERGKTPKHHISKDAIFHYVYGVLHDPIYREKYVQNLKREFPRIPFYADFWCWAEWGEKLMALHIGYDLDRQLINRHWQAAARRLPLLVGSGRHSLRAQRSDGPKHSRSSCATLLKRLGMCARPFCRSN
jgi:predicted helicase